mmetsp:Transcript_24728/g.79950  ORF Transcript_24728/g.79950 Transcript_24728/m.79950 type:complete len:427 (+) Transcript_24728:63-1343(+)
MDLAAKGAQCVVVVQGTAPGQEFGLDAYAWELGPKFGGVSEVEAGLHLLVFTGRSDGVRRGLFVWLEPGEVKVVSCATDDVGVPWVPEGAMDSLRRSLPSLGLGPYPPEHREVWRRIGGRITRATLERCGLEVDRGFLCDDADFDDDLDEVTMAKEARKLAKVEEELDEPNSSSRHHVGGPPPRWTSLDRPRKATTLDHLDGSDLVRGLVRTSFGSFVEVVAEVDAAFLLFAAVGSLTALKQWQRGIALLCSCDALLSSDEAFAALVAAALRAHLELAPPDFFSDPLVATADDVLRPALAHFFESRPTDAAFFAYVQHKFGLFDDARSIDEAKERGLFDSADDAPVVVDDDVATEKKREELNYFVDVRESDPQTKLRVLGFPRLSDAVLPGKEDAFMTAARVLDTPQADPALKDEARRFLILQSEE